MKNIASKSNLALDGKNFYCNGFPADRRAKVKQNVLAFDIFMGKK